jgi:hypothetical protein
MCFGYYDVSAALYATMNDSHLLITSGNDGASHESNKGHVKHVVQRIPNDFRIVDSPNDFRIVDSARAAIVLIADRGTVFKTSPWSVATSREASAPRVALSPRLRCAGTLVGGYFTRNSAPRVALSPELRTSPRERAPMKGLTHTETGHAANTVQANSRVP